MIMFYLHSSLNEIGNFPSLRGKIGNSLAELQHLKHLYLSGNYFEGN